MQKYEILNIANYVDKGGVFELIKKSTTIVHDKETYTYVATGLVRDVFVSTDGKTVIKVPKRFDAHGFEHNRLEVEAYNEAPEWCKKHVAISRLTDEGYCIQEYLKINPDCGNYYRELGFREDGTCVVFDCDIFLDYMFKKGKKGFKYQEVFSKSKIFADAYVEANEIPKRLAVKKQFPNIDNQEFHQSGDKVYIDDVLIDIEISRECGWIYDFED
jgi:hypothetical protein